MRAGSGPVGRAFQPPCPGDQPPCPGELPSPPSARLSL